MPSEPFVEVASPAEPCAVTRATEDRHFRGCTEPLNVELVSLGEIDDTQVAIWNELRRLRPEFRSPFLSLDFLRHAAAIGREVEVGVIRGQDRIVGFFPFERRSRRAGIPVAARMNDVHGVLGLDLQREQLLTVLHFCKLDRFSFHAWFGSDEGIRPFRFAELNSFMAALDQEPNFDRYSDYLVQQRYTLKQQVRKTRKLTRDQGPVELQFYSTNLDWLEKLFRWKRAQFQRTHTFDIFSVPWTTELVRRLFLAPEGSAVRAVLSVLTVAEEPIAMHVGIQEGDLLHYWFPVYDPAYARYSPGAEMFLRIADACQDLAAIDKIDLGYGEQAYKYKLVNQVTSCYCGVLTADPVQYLTRRMAYRSHQLFRTMPLKETVKTVVRSVFPDLGRGNF